MAHKKTYLVISPTLKRPESSFILTESLLDLDFRDRIDFRLLRVNPLRLRFCTGHLDRKLAALEVQTATSCYGAGLCLCLVPGCRDQSEPVFSFYL